MDIYVGNIAHDVTEEELFLLFEEYGTVDDIELFVNEKSETSKGYATVTMYDHDEAEEAVFHINGHKIKGSNLKVKKAFSHQEGSSLKYEKNEKYTNDYSYYRKRKSKYDEEEWL